MAPSGLSTGLAPLPPSRQRIFHGLMDIGQFIVHAMLMYILNLLSLDVFSTVKIVENALAGPLGSLQRSPGPLAGLRGKNGNGKGRGEG